MTDATEDGGKVKRPQQVYSLIVEVGRKEGDGLPPKATGAALLCYASGVDEAEAVRETVAILKEADLSPLEVQGLGTLEERLTACLLYTSDAADGRSSVDPGGRRIIKKQTQMRE